MTKSYKKEERLSSTARELLKGARQRENNAEEAVKYLQSVSPEKLNAYDRQKIGREILTRRKRLSIYKPEHAQEYDQWKKQIENDYNPHPQRTGGKSYELINAESEFKGGIMNKRMAEECEHKKRNGSPNYFYQDAEMSFNSSGKSFESQKKYGQAILAYENALICAEKVGWSDESVGIRKKIDELRGSKHGGLEKATATASIVGILGGLFFLSSNITGNAIADLSTKTTSFLGAGLLIVGLIAGFFWVTNKKN